MHGRRRAAALLRRREEDVVKLIHRVVACKLYLGRHIGPYDHIGRAVVVGVSLPP